MWTRVSDHRCRVFWVPFSTHKSTETAQKTESTVTTKRIQDTSFSRSLPRSVTSARVVNQSSHFYHDLTMKTGEQCNSEEHQVLSWMLWNPNRNQNQEQSTQSEKQSQEQRRNGEERCQMNQSFSPLQSFLGSIFNSQKYRDGTENWKPKWLQREFITLCSLGVCQGARTLRGRLPSLTMLIKNWRHENKSEAARNVKAVLCISLNDVKWHSVRNTSFQVSS